jgi:mRNA-degrading endonuclease RelE of RelBE toxin-antitoxin system
VTKPRRSSPGAASRRPTAALDIKAPQGRNSRWRLRVGDYRAVYTVEDGQLLVWVLAVGNRRDVYRALETLLGPLGRLDDR